MSAPTLALNLLTIVLVFSIGYYSSKAAFSMIVTIMGWRTNGR